MVFNVILHFFLLQMVPGQIHLNTVQYQDLLTASEKATWLSGSLILASDMHKKKKANKKQTIVVHLSGVKLQQEIVDNCVTLL